MIKTENQIWTDLKGLIMRGLERFNVEGWQIRQLQQPLKITTLQPTIFMAKLNSPRIGWQYSKNTVSAFDVVHTEIYKQEIRFQISALKKRNPASLKLCTLLDKPERRVKEVHVDYTCFNIPDEFVVGYGLDYAQRYRNLPFIGVVEPGAGEE